MLRARPDAAAKIERRVVDRKTVKLLRSCLRAGVFEGGIVSDVGAGTPQGSPLSPLLANAALHVLDEAWRVHGQRVGTLVRYCDDFVVLCPTEERAHQARHLATTTLATLGLHLHPEKTRVVCIQRGTAGFDFLGFHHRLKRSWKHSGRYCLNTWPLDRAMASIKAKVKERTPRRYASLELRYVVEYLNPVLRGWGAYFRAGTPHRSSPPSTATCTSGWRSSPV